MEKITIKIIKDRPSANLKVGDVLKVPILRGTTYIKQGYAEPFTAKKEVKELLPVEEKEEGLEKIEIKEVKTKKSK